MPLPNESAIVVVNATAFPHLSTIEKWVVCPVVGASSSATAASADEAGETEHGSPGSAPKSGMRAPSSAIGRGRGGGGRRAQAGWRGRGGTHPRAGTASPPRRRRGRRSRDRGGRTRAAST